MEEVSWMKPDFDLGKVLSSDASGNYRATLERALDELSRRLLAQRSNARSHAAVEQLSRYLEVLQRDPALSACRGILAASEVKLQARTLCEARGLGWVEVDLATLRGEREPELTLFEA